MQRSSRNEAAAVPFDGELPDDSPRVSRTIEGVPTSIAAFIGRTARGPVNSATRIESWDDFERTFGPLDRDSTTSYAVRDFFRNGGTTAYVVRLFNDGSDGPRLGIRTTAAPTAASAGVSAPLREADYLGGGRRKGGLSALDEVDIFNLLCIPPDTIGGTLPATVSAAAAEYCVTRRAMLIADPPAAWKGPDDVKLSDVGIEGDAARNAAVYFPRLVEGDESRGQVEGLAPCGAVAGAIARVSSEHGVWRAPAGIDVQLEGVDSLTVSLSDFDNAAINRRGVNCLRVFADHGIVVWGVRTMRGTAEFNDDFKYVPVRRLALFIEESVDRGLQWAAFEPDDEDLWSEVRATVTEFMHSLFEKGAFAGATAAESYAVRCDATTTTEDDIARGTVNVIVAFAPLEPGEFVIVRIQVQAQT